MNVPIVGPKATLTLRWGEAGRDKARDEFSRCGKHVANKGPLECSLVSRWQTTTTRMRFLRTLEFPLMMKRSLESHHLQTSSERLHSAGWHSGSLSRPTPTPRGNLASQLSDASCNPSSRPRYRRHRHKLSGPTLGFPARCFASLLPPCHRPLWLPGRTGRNRVDLLAARRRPPSSLGPGVRVLAVCCLRVATAPAFPLMSLSLPCVFRYILGPKASAHGSCCGLSLI